jgi:hypothetical protein
LARGAGARRSAGTQRRHGACRASAEPVAGNAGRCATSRIFPAALRVDPSTPTEQKRIKAHVSGLPQTDDGPLGVLSIRGTPAHFVDPGINGVHHYSADGQHVVAKFDAPKATLMSYIIRAFSIGSCRGSRLRGVMIALAPRCPAWPHCPCRRRISRSSPRPSSSAWYGAMAWRRRRIRAAI